jgi:hypothetical protein
MVLALAVAIDPMRISADILVLLSDRAQRAGPLFLAGFVAGIGGATGIGLALSRPINFGRPEHPSNVAVALLIALGLLLLGLASWVWWNRPRPGTEPPLPRWQRSLQSLSPPLAFGLGFGLAIFSFKNLGLIIAADVAITQADLPLIGAVLLALAFVVVACMGVGIPVIWYFVSGAGAANTLNRWKNWLTANNASIMAACLVLLGLLLIGQGIRGLVD